MYEADDTIAAVSSPTADKRVIIRLTGPDAIEVIRGIFKPCPGGQTRGILTGKLAVDSELEIEAELYIFPSPHSYTGQSVVELHLYSNPSVTEAILGKLALEGIRAAGPGEFTVRAYLNGKMDLAQAEAVNEIITGCNRFQLAAAEKLLAGRLGEITEKICEELTECLSLIEAGLDFSGEDIEFISADEAEERLGQIKNTLGQLLAGSIRCERLIDLPAVGIAGSSNAGKSSLLNKMLGRQRSIVSEQPRTTRDILTGELDLQHSKCVLFDCAGLLARPDSILDKLAQRAAIAALHNAAVVIFCVDITKENRQEDLTIRKLIEPNELVAVATKSDSIDKDEVSRRLGQLEKLFGVDFILTSSETGDGMESLKQNLDAKLVKAGGIDSGPTEGSGGVIGIIARHRQAVNEAIENVSEAIKELKTGNEEVVAMLLRAALKRVSSIEQKYVDEKILENIFAHFCIGK